MKFRVRQPSILFPPRVLWRTTLFLSCLLFAGSGCQTFRALTGGQTGFQRLLESVVRIDVREMTFEDGSRRYVSGVGSGVILTTDGYVLTNAHVVSRRAVEISVTLPNLERVEAHLVGWDHWTDLALLRLDMEDVERRNLSFTHGVFGDSSRVFPGQTVFAVGTPNGLTRTVTRGIISNTNRFFERVDGVRGYETGLFNTWLQTDAAINPGNSGGPLVTEDGRIIGINTRAYLGANNLGFAVPSATAREVVNALKSDGEVVRSYVGITPGPLQDLEEFYKLSINRGMLVNSVDVGSPAAIAGIRAGDIILSLGEDELDGRFPEQLPPIQNRIASVPLGSDIRLQVKRGDDLFTVEISTEKLESRVGEEWVFEKWGLSVRRISKAYARENRLAEKSGVLVIGTQRAYPAALAGLNPGDIITRVDRREIIHLEDLKEIYNQFEEEERALFVEVTRNHNVAFHVLHP